MEVMGEENQATATVEEARERYGRFQVDVDIFI
jgi:hypothetical protein